MNRKLAIMAASAAALALTPPLLAKLDTFLAAQGAAAA